MEETGNLHELNLILNEQGHKEVYQIIETDNKQLCQGFNVTCIAKTHAQAGSNRFRQYMQSPLFVE